MAELWLVCEGEPGSVDVRVLQPIFAGVLATEIVVEPACGSSTSVVAQFLEMRRGGRAGFVNDRDYRPRSAAEAAFTDGKAGFLWRRHSIENYLLQPPIVLRAYDRLRERFLQQQGHVPPWLLPDSIGLAQVTEALKQCALVRAPEEACRIATERLWATLPPPLGNVQKRFPPRPNTSGGVEPNDWREALCQEVERVCDTAAQTAACSQFRRESVVPFFDAAYGEITATSFVTGMEFLD